MQESGTVLNASLSPLPPPRRSAPDGRRHPPQGHPPLYADGALVGNTEGPHTTPLMFELEGLSCGFDFGRPVLEGRYQPLFTFTGTIYEVVVDVSGALIEDEEANLRRLMAQQ